MNSVNPLVQEPGFEQLLSENLVNVCACGSSGSTMLANILDRHPDVACGDEMFLFSTPLLFTDYTRFRRHARLLRWTGVPGRPYHQGRAMFKTKRYGISKQNIWRWARESQDFTALCSRIHSHIRQTTGKTIWAEKTPRNVCVIGLFLNYFPKAKAIHLVRDPRDVITSLSGRHKGVLQAAETWLMSVASAYANRHNPRLLQVCYEDLCRNSDERERVLRDICKHLDISYHDRFSHSDRYRSGFQINTDHNSWKQSADQPVSASSIGRYREYAADWPSIGHIRLKRDFAEFLGCQNFSIATLAQAYGYDYAASSKSLADLSNASYTPYNSHRKLDPFRRWLDNKLGIPVHKPAIEHPKNLKLDVPLT